MNIAFIGCGYVFDIYMRTRWAHRELIICGVYDVDSARLRTVANHYSLRAYGNMDELLADPAVQLVVNLTNICAHFEVTRRSLLAGKHVYSEKPITTDLAATVELFELAAEKKLTLTGAPCNLFCDSVSTMWKAVADGAIGRPILVYAELDDNPAHLMQLERVQSPTGAPFPFVEELQEGCTVEHVAYHLVWLCAMFGPAISVSGFSKLLVERKTSTLLDPANTPDFSVGCLRFDNGLAARITCSWVAPRDHRFKIVGEEGEICADNVFHDQTPVRLERFSRVSLSARKSYTARNQPLIGRLFGVGGSKIPLLRRWKSHAVESEKDVGRSLKHRLVSWLRRREVYAQDKFLGIAEMVRAMSSGNQQPMPADFHIHLNELVMMIHRAGPDGICARPTTTFEAIRPLDDILAGQPNYLRKYKAPLLTRFLGSVIEALHRR